MLVHAGGLRADEIVVNFLDLQPNSTGRWFASGIQIPPADRSLPIVDENAEDPTAIALRKVDARGVAAGFDGVLYDNRDRGHSLLDKSRFPRLHHLKYAFELQAENADQGLAGAILYPGIVFGNSSTAITGGAIPRSLTRLAMTSGGGVALSRRQYEKDHIYIYPEHRDYDETDLFPANWTYNLTSQGSSGSDQGFLNAIGATLAAFRPDTLEALTERGLVAPTLQMILRRNLAQVATRSDYFSGLAHRPVFNSKNLRTVRMVTHAAAIAPDEIPPMVQITVAEEDFSNAAGLAQLSERLFDTPSAIARIWRGFEGSKEVLLSASATEDPNSRALTFSWHLLQGDPDRVRIETVGKNQEAARISIDWHDAYDVSVFLPGGIEEKLSSRVDIAVFANNGVWDSAPAIFSISFPTHQKRRYAMDPESNWRLQTIEYDAAGRNLRFDPVLHWSAPWTDTATYVAGELVGWVRDFHDGRTPTETLAVLPSPGDLVLSPILRNRPRVLEYSNK